MTSTLSMPSDTILTVQSDIISTIVSSDINTSSTIVSATQGPPGAAVNDVFAFTADSTTNQQVIDSFSYTLYGSAKYIVYVTSGTSRQICELLVLHDNVTPVVVEYANMVTSSLLATFTIDISGGFVRLLSIPTGIYYNFKIYRKLLPA